MLSTIFSFLFLGGAALAAPSNWQENARALGNPDKREAALSALKAQGGLEADLRAALTQPTQRVLAADVAVSLGLRGLAPDLTKAALQDDSGRILYRLLALDRQGETPAAAELYAKLRDQLGVETLPPGQLAVAVEALPGFDEKLEGARLQKLMSHDFPEVREAAALRFARRGSGNATDWRLVLGVDPYQVRRAAVAGAIERAAIPAEGRAALKEACAKEKVSAVKDACRLLEKKHAL